MIKTRFKKLVPVIVFFVIVNSLIIAGRGTLQRLDVDQEVLLMGNLFLFIITFISFYLSQRGVNNPNPHAFVRSVYTSIMMKLFLCIILAFVYISIYKSTLNKPALFACMGLYLVYTFMEVSAVTKMLKQKPHA